MCNKVGYDERSAAVKDAHLIKQISKNKRARSGKDGKKLRPYLCDRCNKWHLTSRKPRKYDTNKL